MEFKGDIHFYLTQLDFADVQEKFEENGEVLDLQSDEGFQTAILISLFSDRWSTPEEATKLKDYLGGWFGDDLRGFRIGSKLWTLGREKSLQNVIPLLEQYTKEALAWFVEDGIANDIQVTAERSDPRTFTIKVFVIGSSGQNTFFQYFYNWKQQLFGGL